MLRSRLLRTAAAATFTIACVAGISACSSSGPGSDSVAATVNGVEIKEQTITDYIEDFREVQDLTEDDTWGAWMAQFGYTPETVREQVVDQFVDDELTKQAAEENGITVTDEEVQEQVDMMKANYGDDSAWESALSEAGLTEEQYRDNLRNAMLDQRLEETVIDASEGPSDEEILDYVKSYAPAFSGAKRSSHILFNSGDEATAQQVLDQINNGELDFADAAKEYSQDTASAENGGDVGWDLLNQFVAEYTTALGELEQDQVSGLVTSEFGIHIIKCTEVYEAPEEITSLDQVPSELVDYITQMVSTDYASNAYSEWKADYKEKADIVINDMPEGLPYAVDMSKYATEEDAAAESDAQAEADAAAGAEADAATGAEGEAAEGAPAEEEGAEADAAAEAEDGTQAETDAEAQADSSETPTDANGEAEEAASEQGETSAEGQ